MLEIYIKDWFKVIGFLHVFKDYENVNFIH